MAIGQIGTETACLSASSKIESPVEFAKSARTIVSVSFNACALWVESNQPPIARPMTVTAAPAITARLYRRARLGFAAEATAVRLDSVSRFNRCKSVRISDALW